MTKSPRKNVPDVGIELGATCTPSEHASDRATAPDLCCVVAHIYTHIEREQHPGANPEVVLRDSADLSIHLSSEHDKLVYFCPQCGYSFFMQS